MASRHLVFVCSNVAGEAGAITAFALESESGALDRANQYSDIENPFYMALSPDGKRLYSTHAPGNFQKDPGYVVALEIDPASGALAKINERPAQGITTCYVDVDPSGRALAFASYNSGNIGTFPLKPDGSLGEMASLIQHEGASMVDARRQEAAHAHCSVISPNGQHVYASDLGLDQVLGYSLEAATARLTALDNPYVRTLGGGGPRHFTYHPRDGYAYSNNELESSVNVYSYDVEDGTLAERQVISTLPNDFDGSNSTADIVTSPDGRFLYCSNRGHDSIAIYRIGEDGRLSPVEIQPSLGHTAQNLAITPDGGLLLCANFSSDGNVAAFRIDAESGRLTPAGEPVSITSPSCIVIA